MASIAFWDMDDRNQQFLTFAKGMTWNNSMYIFLQCFSLLAQTNLTNEQSEYSQVTFIDALRFAYILGVKRHETKAASSPTHPMIQTRAK